MNPYGDSKGKIVTIAFEIIDPDKFWGLIVSQMRPDLVHRTEFSHKIGASVVRSDFKDSRANTKLTIEVLEKAIAEAKAVLDGRTP